MTSPKPDFAGERAARKLAVLMEVQREISRVQARLAAIASSNDAPPQDPQAAQAARQWAADWQTWDGQGATQDILTATEDLADGGDKPLRGRPSVPATARRPWLVWMFYGLPVALVGVWASVRVLMMLAPETGYRLRRALPNLSRDRSGLRAERGQLLAQLMACDRPHLRYKLARVNLLLGRPREAAILAASVFAEDASHVDAAYILGRAQLDLGHFDDGLAALDRAVQLKATHDYGGLLIARGRGRYLAGNYTGAADDLRQALEQSPDQPEALYWLGRTHLARGDRDAARHCWQRAIDTLRSGPASFAKREIEWYRKCRAQLWWN